MNYHETILCTARKILPINLSMIYVSIKECIISFVTCSDYSPAQKFLVPIYSTLITSSCIGSKIIVHSCTRLANLTRHAYSKSMQLASIRLIPAPLPNRNSKTKIVFVRVLVERGSLYVGSAQKAIYVVSSWKKSLDYSAVTGRLVTCGV